MDSISKALSSGAKGDHGGILQKKLANFGYRNDPKEQVENIFGKAIEKPIIIQSENVIDITGIDWENTG